MNPAVTPEGKTEREMEIVVEDQKVMVPERYIDIISGEVSYDPVQLPPEEDPTQLLYDRKTLQTIWETEHHAKNPLTRQWFDIKSAIPQRELRKEIKQFTKLHGFPPNTLIANYSKILCEEQMKEHLRMLCKYVEAKPITEKQWEKIWKTMNLIRLFCEYDFQNIKLVISVEGIRYFRKLIVKILTENDAKEAALDVGKEIVRAFDVIINGLRSHGENPNIILGNVQENSIERGSRIRALIVIVIHVHKNNEGYIKIQSLVWRSFSTIIHEIGENSNTGNEVENNIRTLLQGCPFAFNKFCQGNANDISSEDLNHGIAILITAKLTLSTFKTKYLEALFNAVIICISSEIERSNEKGDLTRGQFIEAQTQGWHNAEALEKGVKLIKDIATEYSELGFIVREGALDIVRGVVHMFYRTTLPGETANQNQGKRKIRVL